MKVETYKRIALLISICVVVGIVVVYFWHGWEFRPAQEERWFGAVIDLGTHPWVTGNSPVYGAIYVTFFENEYSIESLPNIPGFVLDTRYNAGRLIPEDENVIRENNKITLSFHFSALNEHENEFKGDTCTFISDWSAVAIGFGEVTVILPEGYEIKNVTTGSDMTDPVKVFENNRWRVTSKATGYNAFYLRIDYQKVS